MIRDKDTLLVYVPFESTGCPLSHKRVLVRVSEEFPQYRDIPSWSIVLVSYMANFYKPNDLSSEEICQVSSLGLARWYLEKYA